MSHPVYAGGPDCTENCPGDWSDYHDGYADGHERGERHERERIRAAVDAKDYPLDEMGRGPVAASDVLRDIHAILDAGADR